MPNFSARRLKAAAARSSGVTGTVMLWLDSFVLSVSSSSLAFSELILRPLHLPLHASIRNSLPLLTYPPILPSTSSLPSPCPRSLLPTSLSLPCFVSPSLSLTFERIEAQVG
eukprot:4292019-Pleurochrysis_carterae.AAC.4